MDPSESPTRMPEQPTVAGGSASPKSAKMQPSENLGAIFQPGTVLGARYEIIQMLGLGGMGAVYKARDTLLDRVVALKVIRPDLAADPNVVQRFKQEIILARQITHRNVVRVFDIGEADGVMFITMEFIEGVDLRSIISQRGKLPPKEAVEIIWQVCCGLQAAHAEGVIHRDLKPGNIMQDATGRVVVMDFGLATSLQTHGMTQSGAMLGTMEYMSPEQAKGSNTDARSDIFTTGLILYELLTGKMPYAAESAIASLVMRTQAGAKPASEVDASVPKPLSEIVAKCLERDVSKRYQSVRELVGLLDGFREQPTGNFAEQYKLVQSARKSKRMMIAAIATVVVIGALSAAYIARNRMTTAAPQRTLTVLMSDFVNKTSDGVFDGTLEPAFSLALEGASFVNTYPRNQAWKEARQIQPNATSLDEELAKLVALREGIALVVSGSVVKDGNDYRINVKAVDPQGNMIATAESGRVAKDSVLQAVSQVAARLRKALGDTTPESEQLSASETYTSGSLEAAHDYAVAQELRYSGKGEDAIKEFKKAIELDPAFGTAYAGLAAMYANMGQREEATDYYKLAMSHSDRMTEREKLRTRGGYYLAIMDAGKAIEEFGSLVQKYPADTMGHSALAFAYYLKRDMPKAMEEGQKALDIYPKYVPYRNNVALYALYNGDFEKAAKLAQGVLQDNPSYLKAYITLALSQLAMGQRDAAIATYQKLEKVSELGASFGTNGLADLALYEGRTEDAIGILEKGVVADEAARNGVAAAKKSALLAEAYLTAGDKTKALAAMDRAMKLDKEPPLFLAARFYVEAGLDAKATAIAKQLSERIEPVPRAQALIVTGELQLKHGKSREAIQSFEDSLKISDLWLARFGLGRAYLAADALTEADSQFDRCIRRRGEATDVFMDELQTFHYFPPALYYEGLVQTGMKTPNAKDYFKNFLALKSPNASDALIADSRKRLAQ